MKDCRAVLVLTAFVLTGCAGPSVKSSIEMIVPEGEGKITVLFQDFSAGTSCTIETPAGQLTAKLMPGKLVYPSSHRNAPVYCDSADGSRYAIDVNSSLPDDFQVASTTARPDGTLFVTVSTEKGLVQRQSDNAVTKVQ